MHRSWKSLPLNGSKLLGFTVDALNSENIAKCSVTHLDFPVFENGKDVVQLNRQVKNVCALVQYYYLKQVVRYDGTVACERGSVSMPVWEKSQFMLSTI